MASENHSPYSSPAARQKKASVRQPAPVSGPGISKIKVTAGPLVHRGESRIRVDVPYSPEHLRQLRTMDGAKWSRTFKCWNLPKTREAWTALNALFEVSVVMPAQDQEITKTEQPQKPASREAEKLTVIAHSKRKDIIGLRLPKELREQHLLPFATYMAGAGTAKRNCGSFQIPS